MRMALQYLREDAALPTSLFNRQCMAAGTQYLEAIGKHLGVLDLGGPHIPRGAVECREAVKELVW